MLGGTLNAYLSPPLSLQSVELIHCIPVLLITRGWARLGTHTRLRRHPSAQVPESLKKYSHKIDARQTLLALIANGILILKSP